VGIRQYARVFFTDENFWFKSAIYIYQANHSRFNTAWGKSDHTEPKRWLLNDKPIMEMEKQRQAAKTILAAFLEATINEKKQYLPVFQDVRKASAWLPEDIYVNQYQDSRTTMIANFEEDIDVTTASIKGAVLQAGNLATWKEVHLPYRVKIKPAILTTTVENAAVILGWNNEQQMENRPKKVGNFAISLNDGIDLNGYAKLVFSIGAAEEDLLAPLDLTVELEDQNGHCASLPLGTIGPVHPPLIVRLSKWKWLEQRYFHSNSERLLQTYEMPFYQFSQSNPSFEPSKLAAIRFVFDRSPKGTVVLDDIGVAM
jgi:hypothetical protein